jgi:hypothetical protein
MNNHLEAWEHVKKHIFGSVCEVARRTPWGFKEDMNSIHNVTVEEFLKSDDKFDTIILHILSGEGEPTGKIIDCIYHAYDHCIKLIILEHNPDSKDFKDLVSLGFIKSELKLIGEHYIEDNWGRNMLFALTTMAPLHLPHLNDKYYKENIDKTFVLPHDEGIHKKHLIYTHCSETPIDFELPEGTIYWVAGGGLAFEAMEDKNENILIDSVLRQCIYWTKQTWKTDRLYSFEDLKIDKDYRQWRVIKHNNVQPDSIQHISLQDLDCEGNTVYVSTVHKKYWEHLKGRNNIIDAWSARDKPCLILK